MISNDSMAFFGSLDNYAFGNEVKKFLYKYDIKPIYLSNTKLIDRGSLLVFNLLYHTYLLTNCWLVFIFYLILNNKEVGYL